jgi:hypothetical protein
LRMFEIILTFETGGNHHVCKRLRAVAPKDSTSTGKNFSK